MGLDQLIWIVILLVVLVVSLIQSIKRQRARKRPIQARVRESDERVVPRSIKKERGGGETDWERLIGEMLGIEMPPVKTRGEAEEKTIRPERHEPQEEIERPVIAGQVEEQVEQRAPVTTVEGRHLEPGIRESFPTLPEIHPLTPSILSKEEAKVSGEKIKVPHKIFQKGRIKDAIIFSEIIGPPLAKRKRYRIF